jgi:hypothetical protein
MEGKKFDGDKPRWSLIPPGVMAEYVNVLEYGARKYAPGNWQYVPHATTRYYDAMMRHIDAWLHGESVDSETGSSHLAHAMCCITFLMWLEQNQNKGDVK